MGMAPSASNGATPALQSRANRRRCISIPHGQGWDYLNQHCSHVELVARLDKPVGESADSRSTVPMPKKLRHHPPVNAIVTGVADCTTCPVGVSRPLVASTR